MNLSQKILISNVLYVGGVKDIRMHRSGKFDVTESATCHVTDHQPIRKSLLHFRPDKVLHRTTKQTVIENEAPQRIANSDGTLSIAQAENIDQNQLSAVTTSEISVVGYQPQPAAAVVSKSGREFQPEVKYRRVRSNGSFEPNGSLRDRWRQLNDEFKQLYQQRSKSPQAIPSEGHAQGQTNVPKVNRFKDIDRRFSKVSHAVGNMSARHLQNTTSGRTGSPEMTSSKPKAVFLPTTSNGEGGELIPETVTGEDPSRYVFATDSTFDYFPSVPRQRSLSEERSYPHNLPNVSPTHPVSWYSRHQSTSHRQSNDQRPSSSFYNPLSGRSDNYLGRKQAQQNSVLPSSECEYKTCRHCGKIITSSDADGDDDDDDDVTTEAIIRSRDTFSECKQPSRMVITTMLLLSLLDVTSYNCHVTQSFVLGYLSFAVYLDYLRISSIFPSASYMSQQENMSAPSADMICGRPSSCRAS